LTHLARVGDRRTGRARARHIAMPATTPLAPMSADSVQCEDARTRRVRAGGYR
jgi:hypothetical protein